MTHFAILSEGSYSDYSPRYYIGDYALTNDEFQKKGKEIGDLVIREFESYPERPHVCRSEWCCSLYSSAETEKYDPSTNDRVYRVDEEKWTKLMEEWLSALGFERLPEGIPEINIEYSDVPHN